MKRLRSRRILAFALAAIAGGAAIGKAPAGMDVRVDWYSINAGAGRASTGGEYQLRGSIGQSVVGASWGGKYTLNAGFWQVQDTSSCASAPDSIFCSGFEE